MFCAGLILLLELTLAHACGGAAGMRDCPRRGRTFICASGRGLPPARPGTVRDPERRSRMDIKVTLTAAVDGGGVTEIGQDAAVRELAVIGGRTVTVSGFDSAGGEVATIDVFPRCHWHGTVEPPGPEWEDAPRLGTAARARVVQAVLGRAIELAEAAEKLPARQLGQDKEPA